MINEIQKSYTAYASAYNLEKEHTYTIPKIYSAKGDLTKRWYVYYSFRNPTTGRMTRQTPLTMSINRRFKTVKGRMEQLQILQKATLQALKDGFNPYVERQKSKSNYHPTKQLLNDIIEEKKNSLKESSYSDYRVRMNSFIKFLDKKQYRGNSFILY